MDDITELTEARSEDSALVSEATERANEATMIEEQLVDVGAVLAPIDVVE